MRCFLLVAEEGGFNSATVRTGITQPALSYLIKQLEDELGVPLFHRRARSVVPTDAGRVLLRHAPEIISAVHAAHQSVHELTNGVSGELHIGAVNSIGTYFLPPLLQKLCTASPMVRPIVADRSGDDLMDALLSNRLDVVLAADPVQDHHLRHEHLFDDPILLVCRAGHPLVGRPSIAPAEIPVSELITLSPRRPTGGLVERYLAEQGVAARPHVSIDNIDTAKRMVEEGMGIALLPDMVTAEDVPSDGCPALLGRVALNPPLARRIVLVTRPDLARSRAVEVFLDEVRRFSRTWRSSRA